MEHTMTQEQVLRYLELVEKRLFILTHSGVDWLPEYERELADIDKEIAELRKVIDAEFESKESSEPTEEPIDIVKAEIRFCETKSFASSTWEVYNYILFSDGSVFQPTICFQDSQSAAMKVVEEIYNYPACD